MDKQSNLHKCLIEIEQKLNWGSSENWTNSEFTRLSDKISGDTGISISVSSLRRLFRNLHNEKKQYNPQVETRNALAGFLGYRNWADYSSGSISNSGSIGVKPAIKILGLILSAMLLVGVVFVFLLPQKVDVDKIKIDGENLYGTEIPHAVTVRYNFGKQKGPFYVDWGDAPTDGTASPEPTEIIGGHGLVKHTYYTKGAFPIRLMDREKHNLLRLDAFMATHGWECFVEQEDVLLKLDSSCFIKGEKLHADIEYAASKGVDTVKPYRVFYRNIHEYGVSGDDMVFGTRFMPVFRQGYVGCDHVQVQVVGNKSQFLVTLMTHGCEATNNRVIISDKSYIGIDDDLSGVVIANGKWCDFKLSVSGNQAHVVLDGKKVFSTDYAVNIGDVVGVRFEFKGNGIVEGTAFE